MIKGPSPTKFALSEVVVEGTEIGVWQVLNLVLDAVFVQVSDRRLRFAE